MEMLAIAFGNRLKVLNLTGNDSGLSINISENITGVSIVGPYIVLASNFSLYQYDFRNNLALLHKISL